MNENFNNFTKVLKEHIAIIAIIPTVFGGIWQILQLGGISVNMIRFFSISQLISDGLIMLLFVSPPITIYFVFLSNNLIKNLYQEKNFKLNRLFKSRAEKLRFLFYLAFALIILVNITEVIRLNGLYMFFVLLFFINFSLFFLLFIFLNFLRKYHLIKIYLIIAAITSIVIALYAFNKNYKLNDNIENFNHLINKIEKDECYSKTPSILYFNDKYIFIEITKKNKKTILIKQIEDLFKD